MNLRGDHEPSWRWSWYHLRPTCKACASVWVALAIAFRIRLRNFLSCAKEYTHIYT
ncbi:unnamed protein product [Amoebophrya sp. A25]|nr:unnamed protein product [Amoebophrya sp. A25]|eukprot:GSA25T00006666001.1